MSKFTFGMYKGQEVASVCEHNPHYVVWVSENVKWFFIEESLVKTAIERSKLLRIAEEMNKREQDRMAEKPERRHGIRGDDDWYHELGAMTGIGNPVDFC